MKLCVSDDTVSSNLQSAHGQNSPGPHHFWSSHSCCLVLYSLLYLPWKIADHRLVMGKGDLICLCSRDQWKVFWAHHTYYFTLSKGKRKKSLKWALWNPTRGRVETEPVINAKGQSRQSYQYSAVPRLITASFNLLFLQEPFEREGRRTESWHMLALANYEQCETAELLHGGIWGNRNTCNDFTYQYFYLSEIKPVSPFY